MQILLTIVFRIMTNNTVILIHQNTSERAVKKEECYNYQEKAETSELIKREPN